MLIRAYAGIGSRDTPKDFINLFGRVASCLAKEGYTLRSGGAQGADKAFENGCDKVIGAKEIYLPWAHFEGSKSTLIVADKKAFQIAEQFHPYWGNLSDGAKKLQARNSHQILGLDLASPCKFVICWTKNGSGQGGTGQALRIARHYSIPIFDAGKYGNVDIARKELYDFIITKENAK